MSKEQTNPTNAEIRNHIEYSLKILVSIFDEKLQSLESNISNLNSKIEMLTQRIDFLERTTNSPSNQMNSGPIPIKQEPSKAKKSEKSSSSSLSDALRVIQE